MIKYLNKNRKVNISVYHSRLDENITPGKIYGPAIRDLYVFESCTGGCGAIVINGNEFPIKAGDTYFLMPGDSVTHKTDKKDPQRGVYCFVDGGEVGEALAKAGITSEAPFAPPKLHKSITKELYNIYNMNDDNDSGLEYRQTACIYNILGMLLKSVPLSSEQNMFVKKAIGIMEERYHTPIDIQSLADEVGFSRCYFSTVFKNHTRVSPYEYLASLRVKKACILLKQGDISVAETAFSVGLDPRNFARIFKKQTGITPYEFIKKDDS